MVVLGIIIAILVLGVLVFVHELGHFTMAKANKIGVDAFSVGFGKELFGFTIGETRYRIGVIPFGGYCKMRGEESKDRPDAAADPRALYNRPPLARLLAIVGGPVFNYLFAVLIMTVLFWVGYTDTVISPQIAVVQTGAEGKPTPAWTSGLRSGDTIVSIHNTAIGSFNDIPKVVALNIDKEMEIVFLRNGATNRSKITPRYSQQSGMGFIGVNPLYFAKIGLVQTNSPALRAGLKEGDTIAAIDGRPIAYFYQISELIKDKANKNVVMKINRTNAAMDVSVRLDRFEGKGYLGVYPSDMPTFKITNRASGPLNALYRGFVESNNFIVETLNGLIAMFKGKIDVQRNISGPVRIVQITGEVATKTDLVTLLRFMALISVALGFFNLLPFPGLDGGHVVINFIELITCRKFPDRARTYIEYAGLIFIVGLSIVVFFNDIVNIFLGR